MKLRRTDVPPLPMTAFDAQQASIRNVLMIVVVVTACAGASAAIAHPVLESSSPPSDKVSGVSTKDRVGQAPTSITLNFSELVIARFSGATIEDSDGRKVATGPATTGSGNGRHLVLPLASPLPPGQYTVDWHAVSEDTHRVRGHYSFTVAR